MYTGNHYMGAPGQANTRILHGGTRCGPSRTGSRPRCRAGRRRCRLRRWTSTGAFTCRSSAGLRDEFTQWLSVPHSEAETDPQISDAVGAAAIAVSYLDNHAHSGLTEESVDAMGDMVDRLARDMQTLRGAPAGPLPTHVQLSEHRASRPVEQPSAASTPAIRPPDGITHARGTAYPPSGPGRAWVHQIQGNLLRLPKVGAIVNAANGGLLGESGVSGDILKAGGDRLTNELRKIKLRYPNGMVDAGDAVITDAPNMLTDHVIHAVPPDFRIVPYDKESQGALTRAYQAALDRANSVNLTSVAFPVLSGGIFRGQVRYEDLRGFALAALRAADPGSVRNIYLVEYRDRPTITLPLGEDLARQTAATATSAPSSAASVSTPSGFYLRAQGGGGVQDGPEDLVAAQAFPPLENAVAVHVHVDPETGLIAVGGELLTARQFTDRVVPHLGLKPGQLLVMVACGLGAARPGAAAVAAELARLTRHPVLAASGDVFTTVAGAVEVRHAATRADGTPVLARAGWVLFSPDPEVQPEPFLMTDLAAVLRNTALADELPSQVPPLRADQQRAPGTRLPGREVKWLMAPSLGRLTDVSPPSHQTLANASAPGPVPASRSRRIRWNSPAIASRPSSEPGLRGFQAAVLASLPGIDPGHLAEGEVFTVADPVTGRAGLPADSSGRRPAARSSSWPSRTPGTCRS